MLISAKNVLLSCIYLTLHKYFLPFGLRHQFDLSEEIPAQVLSKKDGAKKQECEKFNVSPIPAVL